MSQVHFQTFVHERGANEISTLSVARKYCKSKFDKLNLEDLLQKPNAQGDFRNLLGQTVNVSKG